MQHRDVSDNVWFERGVRLGLVAYGVVHLLIAWLALQLAFGDRSGAPSEQGAMMELAQKPFGEVLLWIVALGLRLPGRLAGHRGRGSATASTTSRSAHSSAIGSAARVVIYAVFAFSAGSYRAGGAVEVEQGPPDRAR